MYGIDDRLDKQFDQFIWHIIVEPLIVTGTSDVVKTQVSTTEQ